MWQMKTVRNSPTGRSGALGVINKGSEKLVSEIPGNISFGEFKRQHCWKRHIFYGMSYPSSDNKDKETLKCPRFKVWTRNRRIVPH